MSPPVSLLSHLSHLCTCVSPLCLTLLTRCLTLLTRCLTLLTRCLTLLTRCLCLCLPIEEKPSLTPPPPLCFFVFQGGYDPFSFDITSSVSLNNSNELVLGKTREEANPKQNSLCLTLASPRAQLTSFVSPLSHPCPLPFLSSSPLTSCTLPLSHPSLTLVSPLSSPLSLSPCLTPVLSPRLTLVLSPPLTQKTYPTKRGV